MLYQAQCDELGIDVRQTIAFADPVFGDPDLLRQVIENLIRNAIEAQREGGYLEVELKVRSQKLFYRFEIRASRCHRMRRSTSLSPTHD